MLQQRNVVIQNNLQKHIFFKFDAAILERVFINLLNNAIKFSPAGGQILIQYRILEHDFKFEITNYGELIPDDKKDIIFSRYGQVIARKIGKPESTGLGLAFCKMAIEAHQGIIGFESHQGRGTTFWFSVPCVDLIMPDEQLFGSEQAHSAAETVLQIDNFMTHNDYDYLKPLVVEMSKYRIYELTSLKQALMAVSTSYSPGVYIWVHKMQRAIEGMQEELFNRLIAAVLLH